MQVPRYAFPRFDDLVFVTCCEGTTSIHYRHTSYPLPLWRPIDAWLGGVRNLVPDLNGYLLFYWSRGLTYQINIRVKRWRTFVGFNGQSASHFGRFCRSMEVLNIRWFFSFTCSVAMRLTIYITLSIKKILKIEHAMTSDEYKRYIRYSSI